MLHRHSTLFGIGTAAGLSAAVGAGLHWSPVPMVVVGVLGILILPRVFYGVASARTLDKAPYSNPADLPLRPWDNRPSEEERLEKAVQAAHGFGPGVVGPDTSQLKRLAEEEPE